MADGLAEIRAAIDRLADVLDDHDWTGVPAIVRQSLQAHTDSMTRVLDRHSPPSPRPHGSPLYRELLAMDAQRKAP
jgi:hypothetical protein